MLSLSTSSLFVPINRCQKNTHNLSCFSTSLLIQTQAKLQLLLALVLLILLAFIRLHQRIHLGPRRPPPRASKPSRSRRISLVDAAPPARDAETAAHALASRTVHAASHARAAATPPCAACLVRVVRVQAAGAGEEVEDVGQADDAGEVTGEVGSWDCGGGNGGRGGAGEKWGGVCDWGWGGGWE